MALELPNLPYDYDAAGALHVARDAGIPPRQASPGLCDQGQRILEGSAHAGKSLEEICKAAYDEKNAGLINNVGQHYNHLHFWQWMKKGGGGSKMPGALEKAINSDLGGFDKFKADFIAAGVGQFGSGWAWLAVKNGKLEVMKTPNGENPLMHGASPVLGCDVWEHSYYIDYRNARPKYLEAFIDNLINWDHVAEMYEKAV
jgi:Fe-Mn family superoxide dismutase